MSNICYAYDSKQQTVEKKNQKNKQQRAQNHEQYFLLSICETSKLSQNVCLRRAISFRFEAIEIESSDVFLRNLFIIPE